MNSCSELCHPTPENTLEWCESSGGVCEGVWGIFYLVKITVMLTVAVDPVMLTVGTVQAYKSSNFLISSFSVTI